MRLEIHTAHHDGAFLPTDTNKVGIELYDLYDSEILCAQEMRVPEQHGGEASKWMCGPNRLARGACRVLALGSNLDDRFEDGMHALAGCHSYIVDPTVKMVHGHKAVATF